MTTYKVVMRSKRTGSDVIKHKRAEDEGLCRFMINNQYGLHYDIVSVQAIVTKEPTDGESFSTKPRC